jgi:rhodanese-related sulfurtransferase
MSDRSIPGDRPILTMSVPASLVSPAELSRLLKANPGLAVLDVRSPEEFADGHIPEAKNEPIEGLQPEALFRVGRLSRKEPIYLVCHSDKRARIAAARFAAAGHRDAVVVEGGTAAWIEAALPVVRDAVQIG